MKYLKNSETNTVITNYLNVRKKSNVNLTVQTAIDGTEYLTRFGAPIVNYEVEVWLTEEQKELLVSAFDTLAPMEAKVRRGVFSGRIKELSEFEPIVYGWYHATVTLSATGEVSAR